jgi:tRNA pseudouridine55 synthase
VSARRNEPPADGGLVVVDKPAGMTSHDVVSRIRRLADTRRVGHAGTLDPMATGVLVIGLDRATRLLGHLALTDKAYDATIRLGQSTVTDDAEGEMTAEVSAGSITRELVIEGVSALSGHISQVPSSVSAVKVGGVRSYVRARAGEDVVLAARSVNISRFDVVDLGRPTADLVDVDVSVVCSSGTYVRALARDLGASLEVGGHLTRLRRIRVGSFGLDEARTLEQLEDEFEMVPLGDAVDAAFARIDVSEDDAMRIFHGGTAALPTVPADGPYGVFGPDGRVLALMEPREGALRPLVVFVG